MTTILFVSHPEEECGVHQFGKLVFSALAPSRKYDFKYRSVSSPEELQAALRDTGASAIFVNWHPMTMPWARRDVFWGLGVPAIGVIHEVTEELGNQTDDVQFDFYLTHDPSARFTNPIYFSSVRPIPPFDKCIAAPVRPTIGTFGFATPGKGFEALVARVNAEFDDCLIRINIPNSFFCDANGSVAHAVANRCRALITKPKVELAISHDFLTMDGVIEFLAGNSINAFFYENQRSRGISSATDLAIAAGRPIALRRVPMFRHMYDVQPPIFVEERSLSEILADGDAIVSDLKARWSMDQICSDYEAMLDKILPEWNGAEPMRVRRQWMGRVAAVTNDSVTNDSVTNDLEQDKIALQANLGDLTLTVAHLTLALTKAEENAALQSTKATDVESRLIEISAELSAIKSGTLWKAADKLQGLLRSIGAPLTSRNARRTRRLYLKQISLPRPWGIEPRPARNVKALVRKLQGRFPFLKKRRKKPLSHRKQALVNLRAIAAALSDPQRVFDPPYLAKLKAAIAATDRHNEEVLASRRLASEVRLAILEAEIVSCLTVGLPDERDAGPSATRYITIVDARCLQDENYFGRGVGFHAAFALRALFDSKARDDRVLLLVDPGVREIADVGQYCDDVIFSTAAVDLRHVAKFVSLSPMTASIAPLARLLLDSNIHKIALVYDFIPRQFPEFYLAQPHVSIEYWARLCALQRYNAFIPISQATAQELRQVFPKTDIAHIRVSGVVNPLSGGAARAEPDTPPAGYILAPTGGDPRKNLLAVIAAEGLRRTWGKKARPIVAVGRTTQVQRKKAMKLANDVGIPRADLIFMQNISSGHMAELYRRAAVCVVPSRAEGFSIPVVEAAGCGVPVIVSDIPAHLELVGRRWWAVPSRKPAAFAAAIERALRSRKKTNAKQLKRIGVISEADAVRQRLIAGFEVRPRETPNWKAAQPVEVSPRRRRIAVATPWPPQRSGIADYSLKVLKAMAEIADVTALINCSEEITDSHVKTRKICAAAYLDPAYDHVISVLGNSHFHLPAVEYVTAFGGPIIAHDTRMVEFYLYMKDADWLAQLMSTPDRLVAAADLPAYVADMNTLPNLAYRVLARVAAPMLVHSKRVAARIKHETGISAAALPFVPYNVPKDGEIVAERRQAVRHRIGLSDDIIHVGTFGHVDIRTKGVDVLVEAMAWLVQWGRNVRLHVAGYPAKGLREALQQASDANGTSDVLIFHDQLDTESYKDMLLAVDVAVQLRTSPLANLSGALMDCIAYGVATVVTRSMKEEISAPDYVFALPDRFSPLLVAEMILEADAWRHGSLDRIDRLRREFLAAKSMERYSASLLQVLERRLAS